MTRRREGPAHAGMDRAAVLIYDEAGREPRAREGGPDRRYRGCAAHHRRNHHQCLVAHTPRVGTGRLSFWCSSVRIACGCPSAALVSSRPANRTCVPHNPPLTVKAGRVSPQGLRDASAPVRRELAQGLRPATSRPSGPAGRMVSPGQQGSARRRPRLVAATRRAGTRRCKSGRTL